jgi:sRNA-binding protein
METPRRIDPAYRWLRKTFPEAFRQFYTKVEINGVAEDRPYRRALKLGVAQEVLDHPGRPANLSKRAVRRALAAWMRHDVYLIGLTMAGASRWTLDGKPAGPVSPVHRKKAYAILGKRRAAREAERWQEAMAVRKRSGSRFV